MRNMMLRIVMLVIMTTTVTLALGQTPHVTQLGRVQVEMGLDRTDIVVGEPIALKIKMTNTSTQPILELRVNFQFAPGNGLDLRVEPPGELGYRYLGAEEVGTYFSMPMRLYGTRPETVEVTLLFDRAQTSGLLFPKPGNYMLEGKFQFNVVHNPEPMVATLPPTAVTVSEPAGDDAAVVAMLEKPHILALHVGAVLTTQTMEAVSRAAEMYPETELGALALKTKGLQLTRSVESFERQQGIDLLVQYLTNGIIHTAPDSIAREIAATYHKEQQYDLAREWVFWMVRRYPSSALLQPSDPLLSYYYLEPVQFTNSDPWYLVKEPWMVPNSEPPADLTPRVEPGAR